VISLFCIVNWGEFFDNVQDLCVQWSREFVASRGQRNIFVNSTIASWKDRWTDVSWRFDNAVKARTPTSTARTRFISNLTSSWSAWTMSI
jgi:hypothetical protein